MFAWLKLNRLAAEGVALLLLCLLGLYVHHRIYQSGVASVQQADAVALAKAKADAQIKTDQLAKTAEEASHAHDQELTDLRAYRANHPVHVGVCHDANHSVPSVPAAPGQDPGHASPSPASGDVQPVPTGDSSPADIGPLLDLLAGKADKLSSELREYQNR